ncbi:MAG: hypothetical protein ACK48K_10505, partial [Planctomycetota bacterium]
PIGNPGLHYTIRHRASRSSTPNPARDPVKATEGCLGERHALEATRYLNLDVGSQINALQIAFD